jgi:cell division septation protein DedD
VVSNESTLVADDSLLVSIVTYKEADVAAREISGSGLPAFVRVDAAGNSNVLVGPYVTREEAGEAQRQIAALGYPDTRVVVEPR